MALLRNRDFARYIERVSKKLGFALESDDFSGVRNSAHGLTIDRKHHVFTRIGLQLELQYRWCEAFLCTGLVHEGTAYETKTQLVHYENGDINFTYTQPDPGPHLFNPDETPMHECDSVVETDDREEGHYYGPMTEPEEPEYAGALDHSVLLGLAKDNLVDSGDPELVGHWEWTRGLFDPIEKVYNVLSDDIVIDLEDIVIDLGYWSDIGTFDKIVYSFKYRWINTSTDSDYSLTWTQGGGGKSLDLDAGETSDWFNDDIPLASGDNDQITDLEIELA